MVLIISTHHVHKQVAVDLGIVLLHLLLNISSCQLLLLANFSLFILQGNDRFHVEPPDVSTHIQTTTGKEIWREGAKETKGVQHTQYTSSGRRKSKMASFE